MDSLTQQEEYVEELQASGFDFSLVVGAAFIRGMRDIGYKSTGSALNEIIDNSIEAGSQDILVEFGYGSNSDKKPIRLAVIDDGTGMSPRMIRAAVLWGGGHRQNSREGFGRYGFGLPSSCVSIGNRFEVYSRISGGAWHMVNIDLDQISDGTFYTENGRLVAPPAKPAQFPGWVDAAIERHYGKDGLQHGTVVLIDKIDRLEYSTTAALERHLFENFGVTYRNYLRRVNIFVNGSDPRSKVRPVDPLFLDPTARFYGDPEEGEAPLNDLRAIALEPTPVPVKHKDTGKLLGVVTVRYSYMPPGFQTASGRLGDSQKNARFKIMKDNNGILVLRAGRQIDVVAAKCPWLTFVNYDRNWKVEIDFPPALDEEFSITTSKQQVVLSERMWTLLDNANVKRAIQKDLRERLHKDLDKKRLEEAEPPKGESRASEDTMAKARQFKTQKPTVHSPEQEEARKRRLEQEIADRAQRDHKTHDQAKQEVEKEITEKPYKLSFEHSPEAPYYRAEAIGSQVHLIVNRAHPFFSDIYMGPSTTPRFQSQLELLLFVMAECELDAQKERLLFYKSERQEWSQRLSTNLKLLEERDPKADMASAVQEQLEIVMEKYQSVDPSVG